MTNLPSVLARPYRLENPIQHYAWGTSGPEAFIPRLLDFTPEPDTTYAELWLGAHPKAPSKVIVENAAGQEVLVRLDRWVAEYPEAILGAGTADRFGGRFPFLTKVLSAGSPLSIQAHPDKSQAVELHARDPEHYPDDNHKPEIAVALDGLSALMGFKPCSEIIRTLQLNPELADFLGDVLAAHMWDAAGADLAMQRATVHALFLTLIERAAAQPLVYARAVGAMAARIQYESRQYGGATGFEKRFLDLHRQFGSGDVGMFAYMLFNLVHLAPGEALFTPAGVPHAYLGGNIIECMANSDNVVRVGLTPKFKDARTLLEIVDTTPQIPHVTAAHPGQIETVYKTPAQEFELTLWDLFLDRTLRVEKREGPSILLVIAGEIRLEWETPGGRDAMRVRQGESVLVPHLLPGYHVVGAEPSRVFRAAVPIGAPEG